MKKPAGKLTERFAFDARQTVNDGYGNEQGEWVTQFTCAAARDFLRGGEGVIAARLQGTQIALITIWANSQSRSVTTDWRARDLRRDETWNIREAKLTNDRGQMELLCEKGVAHG
jgi:head-tail adaptor